MTVMNKMETALASAKGLSADLKTFSLDTDDQNAKEMFEMLSSNAENMAQMLQNRVNYLRSEVPLYNKNQQN